MCPEWRPGGVRAGKDPLTDPWSPSLELSVMTRRQALGPRAGLRLDPGPGAERIQQGTWLLSVVAAPTRRARY